MQEYFTNLHSKIDYSTDYHVEMLANSDKLISNNLNYDLSNENTEFTFGNNNSEGYRHINTIMNSYNLDEYHMCHVDLIGGPISILINGKTKWD